MNKEKLLLLADLLEKNAANPTGMKFDLHDVIRVDMLGVRPKMDCGTTGCAVGLACLSPEFPEIEWSYASYVRYQHSETGEWDLVSWSLAAELIFDISNISVNKLFLPYYYPEEQRKEAAGELAVARRIRDFVDSGWDAISHIGNFDEG